MEEVLEDERRRLGTLQGQIEDRLASQIRPLAYVIALLRHFRPDFDGLSHRDQVSLIVQACTLLNEFLDTLRKFVAFLEYGMTSGLPNKIRENAELDVTAAVLKDVDGLSNAEIGVTLDIEPTTHDLEHGGHRTAGNMVRRGRKILEQALGKEGWQEHIEAMRTEAARWRSLSDEERGYERLAEWLGKSVEEVRREHKEIEQETRRREAE